MSNYYAKAMGAVIAIAAIASCAAHSQSGKSLPQPAQPPSNNAASSTEPNASSTEPSLTPLETVQYLNEKIADQSRIPGGMDTGSATIWPGYFAIEQSKGTLWWVRGAQTGTSEWEIRYSSVQVDHLDANLLGLGVGHDDYEKLTIKCKLNPDGSTNPCWHNWVASWDDQSSALSAGHFGDLKVARVADHQDQEILNGYDVSVSPLRKQILLFDGKLKQLIDLEPTKPFSEVEIYLGAADSDTAERMFRALKYLLKTMPAAVTENDPFGP
ncbi:MAG: hypothetical protein WBE72_02225 [Terracidiphilus sp.]